MVLVTDPSEAVGDSAASRSFSWSRCCSAALGSPASPVAPVHADELADAKAKQAALAKQIADQKAAVAQITAMQADLNKQIASTKRELSNINADLASVRKSINKMVVKIEAVKKQYFALVAPGSSSSTTSSPTSRKQESHKRSELGERKALLAERIRTAYDTDRTTMLETFLSGGSFTDVISRGRLHQRLRRAGQAARRADRPRPGGARRHPRDGRDDPRPDRRRSGSRRPKQKAELDKQLDDAQGGPGLPQEARAGDGQGPRDPEVGLRHADQEQEATSPRRSRRRPRRRSALSAQIANLVKKQYSLGNIPSAVQRDAEVADGRQRDRASSAAAPTRATGRATAAPTSTTASTSSPAAAAARRSRRPATGGSGTSAGTTPTAATRPGSSIIVHSPGPADLVRPHEGEHVPGRDPGRLGGRGRPGHRLRGQHGPLDRLPPPLDGRVQRLVQEPAAVRLDAVGAGRTCPPTTESYGTFATYRHAGRVLASDA